jgi:hypothetical protein
VLCILEIVMGATRSLKQYLEKTAERPGELVFNVIWSYVLFYQNKLTHYFTMLQYSRAMRARSLAINATSPTAFKRQAVSKRTTLKARYSQPPPAKRTLEWILLTCLSTTLSTLSLLFQDKAIVFASATRSWQCRARLSSMVDGLLTQFLYRQDAC